VLDPGHKTYVSSVATSSLEGAGDIPGSRTSDPYAKLGALLARAYVGRGEDIAIDDTATRIDSELEGAKLVAVDGRIERRGSLVILLASGSHGADVATDASSLIATTLIEGVVSASGGSVVATPPTGASAGGILATLAAHPDAAKLPLATVDISDGTVAQVATIYALSAASHGDGGDFGLTEDGVVLPPGMVHGVD
jgi:3D (Asp-Asp-Asp) domain-containing protein